MMKSFTIRCRLLLFSEKQNDVLVLTIIIIIIMVVVIINIIIVTVQPVRRPSNSPFMAAKEDNSPT